MKKLHLLPLVLFIIHTSLFAQIPDGYYSDAEGLTGENLKTELYNIIKDHNSQSYNALWTHFESTDAKDNGKVWDMYSDVPGGTPPYEYEFGTHQCGNYSAEGDCYNREHSFPGSWFNDGSPMDTDMFHIVPTDGWVNNKRGNLPYGETSSASWTSENGSKKGSCSYTGYNGTIFEPIDEYKGDFARGYLYMVTRYEGQVGGWSSEMLDGTAYPAFEEWAINMLIEWHNDDPVSQKELDRNNAIHDIQNNRNPFIDHPEYVEDIWGDPNPDDAPVITNISIQPESPASDDPVTVTADITDNVEVDTAFISWGTTSGSPDNTMAMSNSTGDTYTSDENIPAQENGTTVYYKITAKDNESNKTKTNEMSYEVAKNPTLKLLFFEAFEADLGYMNASSVTGDQEWVFDSHDTDTYAKMSGYDDEAYANEDWLVTPALDFSEATGAFLQFREAINFANDIDNKQQVFISTDYTGTGDPNDASWSKLTITNRPSGDNWDFVTVDTVDLSEYAGEQSVYIGFKYTSTTNNAAAWEVDSVKVMAEEILTYTVTFDVEAGNGSISAKAGGEAINSGDEAEQGTEISFSAEPDEGWQVSGWYEDAEAQEISEETYTISDLQEDVNVTVEFEEDETNSIIFGNEEKIEIYPNPTDGDFYVNTENSQGYIKVYNVMGELLINKSIDKEQMRINISDQPTGIYLLKIYISQASYTKQLIKQ